MLTEFAELKERAVTRRSTKYDGAWALLLEAYQCAVDVHRSTWRFAVTIHSLRLRGVTDCYVQWMCCKGFLDHGIELVSAGDEVRRFRRARGLRITSESCFVLTELGAMWAERLVGAGLGQAFTLDSPPAAAASPSQSTLLPYWDADRRELRVGPTLVKSFRVPARNQETILSAFQEENWPVRIDDPLPPAADINPKQRLHSTIQCLNRNRKANLVHFHGDGCGMGVCWDLL
jgi:hypothetical protein